MPRSGFLHRRLPLQVFSHHDRPPPGQPGRAATKARVSGESGVADISAPGSSRAQIGSAGSGGVGGGGLRDNDRVRALEVKVSYLRATKSFSLGRAGVHFIISIESVVAGFGKDGRRNFCFFLFVGPAA